MQDKPIGMVITRNSIVVYFADGERQHCDSSHRNYETIKTMLEDGEHEGLRDLFSIEAAVRSYVEGGGDAAAGLVVQHGSAYYNGYHLDNALGKKLVEEMERERPIPNYINFLEKVMQNPSKTAIDELLLFIEAGYMAIHEDGDFLAYKKVRNNFRDLHTGTFDNSPGQVCEMPRYQVDDDRNNLCSAGLHFCSYDYLKCFGGAYEDPDGNKVVLVKINPKDVVSIPADYGNTKGRTARYEVLQEVTGWGKRDVLASPRFYGYLDEEDDDCFYDDYGDQDDPYEVDDDYDWPF